MAPVRFGLYIGSVCRVGERAIASERERKVRTPQGGVPRNPGARKGRKVPQKTYRRG